MNADYAQRVMVQSVRNSIRDTVADAMLVVLTGKGREIRHPFTGRTEEKFVSPELRSLASRLTEVGLNKDTALLADLRKVLEDAAAAPVWHIFTAFDGEGAFSEVIGYEVHARGIGRLSTHLHELLHPIDGDLLTEKDA